MPLSAKHRRYSFWLSLVLSLFLLAYLFSQIRLGDLIRAWRGVFWPSLGLYLVCNLAGVGLRAYRYWLLTLPHRLGYRTFLLTTLVRNLFVDLLPAKIGSLSYIYVLVRRFRLPFDLAASGFLLSALFDSLALAPLLLLAGLAVGLGQTPFSSGAFLAVILSSGLALTCLVIYFDRVLRLLTRVWEGLVRRLSWQKKKWVAWLDRQLELISSDIRLARKDRGLYLGTFFVSLAIRGLKYVSLYFLTHAFLQQFGYPLVRLDFWVVLLTIAGAELSSLLPVQGLAGLGTWEAAWTLTFSLLGFDTSLAILTGLCVHLTTQIWEYVLGIASLLYLGLTADRSPAELPDGPAAV